MAESLEKLHSRILSDAGLKASGMVEQAEEKSRQILEEAKAQAQRDANDILARAGLEAESIRRSILSSRIRANRLKILDERNRIVQSVLKSVEQRLSEFATTGQFESTLKRLVMEAVEALGTDNAVVRVGYRNAEKKSLQSLGQSLPKGTKFVSDETAIDDLGGVIASDPDGKVIFNNSFKARIERLDNQLLTTISSTIFGE
ncbi:MAG TPA: V-type ATP synthase subunit E family protein [Candidatus Bathyarchaeia archaeon]|nr:V-type ATP synthase subunit E family protein [Candidatus Bathyarchaeia archaeon]